MRRQRVVTKVLTEDQAMTELVRLGSRRIETPDGVVVITPVNQGGGSWSFIHSADGKEFATSYRTGIKTLAEAREELETICEDYRS